jgi:hypothetical protein
MTMFATSWTFSKASAFRGVAAARGLTEKVGLRKPNFGLGGKSRPPPFIQKRQTRGTPLSSGPKKQMFGRQGQESPRGSRHCVPASFGNATVTRPTVPSVDYAHDERGLWAEQSERPILGNRLDLRDASFSRISPSLFVLKPFRQTFRNCIFFANAPSGERFTAVRKEPDNEYEIMIMPLASSSRPRVSTRSVLSSPKHRDNN